MWVVLVVVLVAALVGGYVVVTYNAFVRLRNRVDNAWAQIDVQLKRRYDLIPNLVETVKGYASHEKEALERVIQARNRGVAADNVADQAQAEGFLTQALRQVFALSEAYPELKADARFGELQAELTATEERIAFARQFYNDTVLRLNTKIETFPSVLVARAFGVEAREYFDLDDDTEARGPVSVEF